MKVETGNWKLETGLVHHFANSSPLLDTFSKCRVGGFGVVQNSMMKTDSARRGLIDTE